MTGLNVMLHTCIASTFKIQLYIFKLGPFIIFLNNHDNEKHCSISESTVFIEQGLEFKCHKNTRAIQIKPY